MYILREIQRKRKTKKCHIFVRVSSRSRYYIYIIHTCILLVYLQYNNIFRFLPVFTVIHIKTEKKYIFYKFGLLFLLLFRPRVSADFYGPTNETRARVVKLLITHPPPQVPTGNTAMTTPALL